MMRASESQRVPGREISRFHQLSPACVGVARVQRGVAGGSLKNARGREVWGCESAVPTVCAPLLLFELFSG